MNSLKYKGFCLLVIITIHILQVTCSAEENGGRNDTSVENQNENDENFKNKSKRGIFYVGRGLQNAYSAPVFGFHSTPLISSPFIKPIHTAPSHIPYVIRPGGASITSYNVNYLRHPYLGSKTFTNLFPYPTLFNPIIPSTPVVPASPILPANPVIPASPVASNPIFPVSPVIPTSPFFPNNHVIPTGPAIPSTPIIPAAPVPINPLFPNTFVIPQRPVIPLPATPTPQRPVIIPSATGPFPSIVPVGVPGPTVSTTGTIPTTTSTVTPTNPSYPVHHPHGQQPWRPIANTPTLSTPHGVHRPSISLLPPYEGTNFHHHHHSHRANIEDFQSSPSREYLGPVQQLQLQRQQQQLAAILYHQRLLQEQQQQQQQQSELGNQVENLEQNGDNSYYGVSSYDVPLHGNKGYSYNN